MFDKVNVSALNGCCFECSVSYFSLFVIYSRLQILVSLSEFLLYIF